jgi:hypothetical protein
MSFKKLITEKVFEQREEILRAFIAKYKVQPDDCEQIIEQKGNKIIWRVQKRSK